MAKSRRCWSRKASRKNRKASRKNRKASRKNRKNMMGGSLALAPSPVQWEQSLAGPSKLNLAQGNQYASFHQGQHGGAVFVGGPYPGAVADSVSPMTNDPSSRVAPLNQAFEQIRGLSDQAGGRRSRKGRKASRKSRKASRKSRKASRKSRKGRKASRKTRGRRVMRGGYLVRIGGGRKMRGGAAVSLNPMDVPKSGEMLLPQDYADKAAGLNAEWALAKNPMAFAPKA